MPVLFSIFSDKCIIHFMCICNASLSLLPRLWETSHFNSQRGVSLIAFGSLIVDWVVKILTMSNLRSACVEREEIIYRRQIRCVYWTGLGPNTHFGIKYKYNSAKNKYKYSSFLDFNSNSSKKFNSNTNTLLFLIQIRFNYIVILEI